MNIRKKRIRSISRYLPGLETGKKFRVAVSVNEIPSDVLTSIGFPERIEAGHTIIPAPVGPVSEFNANGRDEKRRDLPKVHRSYSVYTTWNDWHGYPHSGIQNRTIMAYPIEHVPGPSQSLTAVNSKDQMFIVSAVIENRESEKENILHVINLYLEVFGHCTILNEDISMIALPKLKALNWRVLPQGDYPWSKAKDHVRTVTDQLPEEKKQVVEQRLKHIAKYKPDFMAIGRGGFSGYFIMGFELQSLYIFESIHLGNATYVFEDNWKHVSKLTKKEILDDSLHKARIVHSANWERYINSTLN